MLRLSEWNEEMLDLLHEVEEVCLPGSEAVTNKMISSEPPSKIYEGQGIRIILD